MSTPPRPPRATWAALSDSELLAQCEVDTYRASGPGGQKRNKTSSAVRLRHPPSGLTVIAEESRSQHENKARALSRLRRAIHLHLRDDPQGAAVPLSEDGRLSLRAKDPRFWPAAGAALDVLHAATGRVSTASERLGVSTANLVEFLRTDPRLWQEANRLRVQFGLKPLRST
jgi:peptide chain release factor-like protein